MPETTTTPAPAANPASSSAGTGEGQGTTTPPAQNGTTTPPAAAQTPPPENKNIMGAGAKDGEGQGQETPEQKAAKEAEAKKAQEKTERQKNMTPEQKAEDDRKQAEKDAAEKKAKSVPEDGKYDLKLPDGRTLPQALMDKFQKNFAGAKLTNEQAAQFTETGLELVKAVEDKINADVDAQDKVNVEAIKNHKEYGGARFEESKAIVNRVIRTFATPELVKLLDETKMGNDPALFETFLKIGRKLGEDPGVKANPDGAKEQTDAQILFGEFVRKNQTQNQ